MALYYAIDQMRPLRGKLEIRLVTLQLGLDDAQSGSYPELAIPGSPEKRRRVYECYWTHFAAEIHLSE